MKDGEHGVAGISRERTVFSVQHTASAGTQKKGRVKPMVVSEKGLLKAMKDAYKLSGYVVAARDDSGIKEIVIQEPDRWKVLIEEYNMPRKVLGLIAEHLGKIPEPGEVFQVKKGEAQTVLDGVIDTDSSKSELQKEIYKTELTWQGCRLWQTEDKEIVSIDPELESIMSSYGREVFIDGNGIISVTGYASSVFITAYQNKKDTNRMQYLSGYNWKPEV